jgi:hypothetical protein
MIGPEAAGLSQSGTMDHDYIEQHHITDRYVLGTLPPDESDRFEEHYLSCQECLDRLELAESMERGFKRAAGQDAARVAATRQIAILAWLSRLGRSRQMAFLAMAVLVVAVLPGLLGLREVRERERELAATRSALEQERQQTTEEASEAEKQLRRELEASRSDLERERQARASADEKLEDARRPQGNVPILFLNPERGGGEPTHRLRLPKTPGWIVLALEVDPPHRPSYRAVLRDAKGRELWRGDGLQLNEMETLSLSLPSTLLAPGDYTVEVDGRRFTFRVLK